MKSITFITCLILLLEAHFVNSQNFLWGRFENNAFNNIVAATASDVTSDYGVRNAVGGTRFHRGVDISPLGVQNVILAAPATGTITDISNPGPTSIKILEILLDAVQDPNNPGQNLPQTRLRFLHIFSNGNLPRQNSGFRLQSVTVNGASILVIVDLVNCRAFSTVPGLQVTCNGQPIGPNNQAILTVNVFEANWPIAPMGDSGMWTDNQGVQHAYAYHTHVSQLENGSQNHNSFTESIDPFHDLRMGGVINNLECRIRNRNTAPLINIDNGNLCEHNHNGAWNNFIPNYGNNTRTVVEAEVYLDGATAVLDPLPTNPQHQREDRYINAFMNESLVEIQIAKNDIGNFQLIQGRNFESRFRIDPREGNVIYPNRMRNQYGGTGEGESGTNPYSYTTGIGFHPHDYYLTPDFYLRIHQNHVLGTPLSLANYPWDARFLDGDYSIRARVTNIDGVVRTQNPPVLFDIDNFKPFVREVEVKFEQEGANVYSNSWSPDPIVASPSRLQLGPISEEGISNIAAPGPLTIYAKASETMQSISARIPSLTTEDVNGVLVDALTNQWRLTFNNITLPLVYGDCHKIIFRGQDLNGNQLLNFQIEGSNPTIPTNCNQGITKRVVVPKRTGANPDTWDNATAGVQDEVHRFRIQECGPMLHGLPPDPDNNTDCEILAESVSTDVHYSTTGQSNGSITLTVSGNPSGIVVTWFDESHNQLGQGLTLANLPLGWYCYELKDECCIISDCIEVGTCAFSLNPTLQHPSAHGVSDGSIKLFSTGGNGSVSYLWSNGATTSFIGNLGVGTYTVTVTDGFHCSAVATVNLINCPAITVVANAITFVPSACDATDGYINLNSHSANGGTSPYFFHWEDENGNVISNGPNDMPNLAPGKYCLVAVDALGCKGSQCFNLVPDHYPIVEETILPSCSGGSNGSIFLVVNSNLAGFYTFTWDDDVEDSGEVYSWRQNISAGTYCVTITSEVNFCSVTKCYDVPKVTSSAPLGVTSVIINPCPGANNGGIQLTVSGGVEPYTFDWLDLHDLNEPRNRNGLGAGIYKVSITDYCGAVLTKEFNLVPVSIIKTLAYTGCAGLGQVEVVINQATGSPPYSVSWSNGSNNYTISNLASGDYCVSVIDAIGCVTSQCITLANKEYKITKTPSCIGMSDGVISVHITNPDEEAVFVYLDGAEIYSNLAATPAFTVDIPSLEGGLDFNIVVKIGDCIYPTTEVRILIEQLELVYDHYDDPEDECVYSNWCKGNIIPNSYSVQPPGFDFENGIANISSCKIPIYCGFTFIEDMNFDKITVRAAEYYEILLQAADFFPSEYMEKLFEDYESERLNPCNKVRFCSATLEIMSTLPTLAPNAILYDDGNGCYSLDCTPAIPWQDNDFCITTPGFYPTILDIIENNGQGESCNPAKANLYQLIVWEDALKAAFPSSPSFEESALYNYITQYKDDPRAKCVDVIFCQRDFSVVWTTNIELVYCDDYLGYNYGGDCQPGGVSTNDCQYWICANPNENNIIVPEYEYPDNSALGYNSINIKGHRVLICSDFPGDFFTSPGNDEYMKMSNGCTDGTLINFANAISEGVKFPKGITKCGNTYEFMDYSFKSIVDRLWELPETEYLIDDWDSSQITLIRKIEPEKSYSIDCLSDIGWSRLLTSNVRLKISYFEKEGNEYVIGGEFVGNLYFGSTQISTQYTKTGFVIRVSPQGILLDHNIIRNLGPQKPLVFVRGADGVHIVGRSTNQPLTVDGTVYPIQNGYLTDVRVGENGGGVTSNLLAFDSSLTIVRSQRSLDNSRITYVLRGNGSVHYGGEQVIGNSAQDLIVVTCSNTGSILWAEKINGQNIVGQDFDIAYGTSNNLIIGITYNHTISVQGQTSVSNGNSDILLARFNEAGEINGTLNYGTSDGENISKMFFADSILYFGGEFEGDTMSRKIGTHTFLIDSNVVSMPYMSFIVESSFTQEDRGTSNKPRKDKDNANSNLISVFPNPFSNDLTLRILSSEVEQVSFKVFDGLGHLVNEQMQQANLGNNEYSILTSPYPKGVYLIQVVTESGNFWSQKVVKN